MGKVYDIIDQKLSDWLSAQKLFFVATAPLSQEGHVNCSPKDGRAFRILSSKRVAYADLTGSGVETIAHLKENRRIVLMFCALDGAPKIVRLHGEGKVIEPEHPDFSSLQGVFGPKTGLRSYIVVEVTRISDSCGYGVPLFEYQGERSQLTAWVERKGPAGIREYQAAMNANSIDGLPGFSSPDQSDRYFEFL